MSLQDKKERLKRKRHQWAQRADWWRSPYLGTGSL